MSKFLDINRLGQRRRAARAARGGLLWLVLGAAATTAVFGDVVTLTDGSKIAGGKVIELGGNIVAVDLRSGRRKVYKRDIAAVSFSAEEPEPLEEDIVFRRRADSLRGAARVSEDGKSVTVTLKNGSVTTLPSSEVVRIVYHDRASVEDGAAVVYDRQVEETIDRAIRELGSPAEAERAEEILERLGIFAIPRVEAELEALAAAGAEAAEGRAAALRRIHYLYRLQQRVGDNLESMEPRIYDILTSEDVPAKQRLLETMFTRYPEDAVPLGRLLLSYSGEDASVRGTVLGILRNFGLNRELLDLYSTSRGQLQLLLAVALGKNRLLVGLPTLIDALGMEDRAVRHYAFERLQELTSQTFDYHPDDTPLSRRGSIARWRAWWQQAKDEVYRQAEAVLAGKHVVTDERRKAEQLARIADTASEQGNYDEARELLEKALKEDPFFLVAHLHLAILLYTRLDDPDAALAILNDLLVRRLPGTEEQALPWVHYHTGRILELKGRHDEALAAYRHAVAVEPAFHRAHLARAELLIALALRADAGMEQRRKELGRAVAAFAEAGRLIAGLQDRLVLLYREDLPLDEEPAIDMREHNRKVLAVKRSLRLARARGALGVARAHSLLRDPQAAIEALTQGAALIRDDAAEGAGASGARAADVEARALLADISNYLGVLYESQGNHAAALREYRTFLREVDASNAEARDGLRRAEASLSRAPTGAGARRGR